MTAEPLESIQAWVDQLKELVAQTNMSQRQLAKKLNMSPSTLSRFINGKRLPDQRTVADLVDVVDANGGSVDLTTVLRARAAAEKVRRLHPNGHPVDSTTQDTDAGDSGSANDGQETEPRENELGVVPRRRRTVIGIAIGIAALAIAAAIAITVSSGTSQSAPPRTRSAESDARCLATSCTGKNHNTEGCRDDARPLPGGKDDRTVIIDVMYSPACQAAWGKAKGAPNGAVVTVSDAAGLEQRARGKSVAGEPTPKPTPMIPAPAGARVKACIVTTTAELCTDSVEIPAR